MKLKNAFLSTWGENTEKEHLKAIATISVDGLGEVQIQNALSDELMERVQAECFAALKIKIGQVIK